MIVMGLLKGELISPRLFQQERAGQCWVNQRDGKLSVIKGGHGNGHAKSRRKVLERP